MENEHKKEVSTPYSFLEDRKVNEVFSKIDYNLRSGIHIQREFPKPEELFRFINRNFESLQAYYKDLFQLQLRSSGEQWTTYYYLDFDEENRSRIPGDYREYLKTEVIIIGMLFWKIFKIDANIELDTVNEFIRILFSDYEEEKRGLFTLLADAKGEPTTDFTEKKVIDEITKAFDEFGRLGWIAWETERKEKFKCMPSFERLRKIYQLQILGMEELIKRVNNEK